MPLIKRGNVEYYMDGYLKANLDQLKEQITKDWDFCLDGNTLISTNKGVLTLKEIHASKDIRVNTYNFKKDKIEQGAILVIHTGEQKCFKIETEDGQTVNATEEHKFFIKRNKKIIKIKVKDLKEGDELICQKKNSVTTTKIKSITPIGAKETYDFQVEPNNNLFLHNGILASNCIIIDGQERCLAEDTLIKTDNGHVPINKLIDKSFMVDTYNITKNKKEAGKASVINTGKQVVYELETHDGKKVQATKNHTFFIIKEKKIIEIKLKDLTHGDVLYGENPSKIKLIKKIGIKQTYDLKVYPNHNFFLSNGILCHNSGKSLLAQQCAKFVDPTFTLDRVCMTGKEFLLTIDKAEKGQAVILDEAYKDLDSAQSQRKMQGVLKHAMAEMGQKNLFVFIVLPSFFELTKYVSIHRSIALLHVYTGKSLTRGFFTFYGKKKKQRMYMRGKKYLAYCEKADFWGRFSSKYVLDEQAYRDKKADALKLFGEEFSIGDIDDIGDKNAFKYGKSLGAAFRILEDLKFTKTDAYRLLHLHNDGDTIKLIKKWVMQSEKYEEEKFKGLVDYKTKIKEQREKIQMKKTIYCTKCGVQVKTPLCTKCFKEKYNPKVYDNVIEVAKAKIKKQMPITETEAQRLLVDGITVSPKENYSEYQRQYRVLRKLKSKIKKEFAKQKKENVNPNLKIAGANEQETDDEENIFKDTKYDGE